MGYICVDTQDQYHVMASTNDFTGREVVVLDPLDLDAKLWLWDNVKGVK